EAEAMEEGVPAAKAGRKKPADDLEEEAAAALFDDEESVARPVEDEGEAVAVAAEDDRPRRKNGKKAARAEDEETAAVPVEDEGNYDEALAKLAEAPADDKAALAARGEARWLKYLKEQTEKKQPLDEKSKEVQDALKDLTDAGQPLRAEQVTRAITAGQMQGQF